MRAPRLALLGAALGAACSDELPNLGLADNSPDAGCLRSEEPATYDVFFAIDVSGSMGPFLTDMSAEMVSFTDTVPERTAEDRPVRADYRVVAFVNDVRHYGCDPAAVSFADCRMTSAIAVQAALEQAVADGASNNNLNSATFNAEREENLLDALAEIIAYPSTAEAKLVLIATDAPFVEAPTVLKPDIRVQSTYADILAGLRAMDARVHAFTASALDGLTRPYRGMDKLTSLPGSSEHRLQDLTGARERIRETLSFIAREAACH